MSEPIGPRSREGGAFLGIPASALAALPACPACYPAYAAILSGLGLGALANVQAQAVITSLLLAAALGSLFYRARCRRGFGPFALGLAASVAILGAKFLLGFDAATYAGIAVLVAAGLWNVWPKRGVAPITGVVLAALLLGGCGPISAPPGAEDLRENPGSFAATFDRDLGQHRLVLLLSPG